MSLVLLILLYVGLVGFNELVVVLIVFADCALAYV